MPKSCRCRALRAQGLSLDDIADTLDVSRSTVYGHIRDIPLKPAQRRQLHLRWRATMAAVNARRRGIAVRRLMFRKPEWSLDLVHLIAHLAFDGRVDRYGCHYYSRSLAEATHVRRLLLRLLSVPTTCRLRSHGVWEVRHRNVELAAWLAAREGELLSVIDRRPAWKLAWLKAFFDDEGHVHIARSTRRVRASQHDPGILLRAKRYLVELGISARIDSQARAVEVSGRSNLVRFRDRINFSSGLFVNPERKNGYWHTQISKRELLERALRSYRVAL